MARKGPSMKGLKKLFSRSEANLSESADKDRSQGDKKRFRLPTLRTKSKSGSERSLNESQQLSSDVGSSIAADDGEVWTSDVVPKNKRSSLYGTAPRSKDKDMSYSELDLRKPKRFATFSFGFKKKKKKDEDGMSRSTFGLHTEGIAEQEEDLGQMKLTQTNTKRFSMSEPELDTSGAFDIPSPPPVANHQPESYFTLTSQPRTDVVTNGLDVHREPLKAPIASIPEAQLDDPDPPAERENVPNGFKTAVKNPEIPPEVQTHPAPAGPVSSASASSNLPDGDESSAPADKSSLPYLDSRNNPAEDSPPLTDSDKSHLSVKIAAAEPEVSLSDTTSAIPGSGATAPVSPDVVYGALYESLFPQNFTSEVFSSLKKPSSTVQTEAVTVKTLQSQTEADACHSHRSDTHDTVDGSDKTFRENSSGIYTEMTQPATRREIVMIKTFNERHAESVLRLKNAHRMNGKEPGDAIAPQILTENTNAEIKQPAVVETLKEIRSESTVRRTSHEPENSTGVDHPVERFVTLGITSEEVSVPQKVSPPETKKAIMVKTLYERDAEADIVKSWSSSSRDSDSTVRSGNHASNSFSSSDDKTDREPKKQAVMIKTLNEIHTESCVVLSPKVASGESLKMKETLEKTDLARIVPEIERLESEKPFTDEAPGENQTEANGVQKTDSVFHRVKDGADGIQPFKEKSAEIISPQILTDVKIPEPERILVKIPEPERITVRIPEPEHIAVKIPEPEHIAVKIPEPERITVKMPEPERITVKMPEPERITVRIPEPERIAVKIPEPEHIAVKIPEPERITVKMPEPERIAVQISEPESITVQIPEPERIAVKIPEPEGITVQIPEPERIAVQIPEPESITVKIPEPERITVKMPEPDPGPVVVKTSHIRISDQSDYDKIDDSVDTFTSVRGKSTNSAQVLSGVRYTEIDKEAHDNDTEDETPHFQVSSSHQPEENRMRDTVEFPSVRRNSVEKITESRNPDVLKTLSEISAKGATVQAQSDSVYGTRDTISRFVSDETAISSELGGNPGSLDGDLPDWGSQQADRSGVPQSESSHSYSEVKLDLAPDGVGSVPASTNAAPPISDCATSQGTDAQVTDSQRWDILPDESVGDGASADAGSPSAVKGVVLKIRTESLSDGPGQMEGAEGPTSPSYLSIGSEEGATLEVYYSAEEGDEGESGDELLSERHAGQTEAVIVEMKREGDERDDRTREEETRQLDGEETAAPTEGTGMNQLLGGNDAKSVERKDAAAAAQIKEEGAEVRKEELPATPVQQVNTLTVCDFAPPGEGEEAKCSVSLETEDHAAKQLPSPEGRYLSYRDNGSTESTDAASSHKFTPDEAEEPLSLSGPAGRSDEVRGESTESDRVTIKAALTGSCGAAEVVTGGVTRSAELQSEHNRAPPSSQWADPAIQSPDTLTKVAVELSEPNVDARRPDTEAAEAVRRSQERPAKTQSHLSDGSLTVSSAAESHATESEKDSVTKMNKGYSSLSTKLSLRTSTLPKEDESKLRIHKLSLIKDDDGASVSRSAADSSDSSSGAVTEISEVDFSSDYKWKNRFEGVSQFVPKMMENSTSSDSLSYRISESSFNNYPYYSSSSSSSSTLPEATAYTHLSEASSSPSAEQHSTPGGHLTDRTVVFLRRESEAAEQPRDTWRRSYLLQELQEEEQQPAAPAPSEREAESEEREPRQLPAFSFSSPQPDGYTASVQDHHHDEDDAFTGVFKATLVELLPDPVAPPSTPPASPEDDPSSHCDMESLVDTLKSMGPSMRPRGMVLRPPAPTLMSSLPPIVEDAASPVVADAPDSAGAPAKRSSPTSPPAELPNGQYALPADLGLRKNARDLRSPLELMKQGQDQQQQPGARNLSLHLRASTNNSIAMKSSDSSPDELQSPVLNGNGVTPSPTSRLDNSVLFGSYRSSSIDQTLENGKSHRPLFRTGSLPDTGPVTSRISAGPKELGESRVNADPVGSRSERLSFLLNASSSSTGSLPGSDDLSSRISRPPSLGITSPPATTNSSTTRVLTSSASLDLPRTLTGTDTPLSVFGQMPGIGIGTGTSAPPLLQRSLSSDGLSGTQPSLFGNLPSQFQSPGSQFQSPGSQFQSPGSQFQSPGSQFQSQEPDKNVISKYRAFPDAYLTKEKEHGKLNPRPGKMYIFDRPGMCGQRLEIRSDIVDATSWELQETISIRVVRGGWVMYEKPDFKGEKIALDEGDIELTYPFAPPEEQLHNGQQEAEQQPNGEQSEEQSESKPSRRFIIGSIRRAVRDYSVPDISLFPEENAEGKKVIFRDTSEDARIFGFPIKANSIIINAGLWLVYAQPFFQGVPRVLEVGGYPNPAAWGVEQPYVGSLHPLKVGEPRVENLSEPKMVIYDKPYFTGKFRTITATMRDFMTRLDRQQTAFMYSVGSLKVLGGIWVGYEKEGFRGHQYLLEEGEYHDWRVWGGCNPELRSVRVIRADFTDPLMVMFEQPEEDQEGMQEENTFEVTEAIPDVELFEYKTSTRSIHVLSGAWIAYSHVDFSGNQYVLEKGFYNNCADWGSADTRICSVQPILLAPTDSLKQKDEILLYSEPDFQGECHVFTLNQEALPDKLLTKSCRVARGSWVLFENKQFAGAMFVLSEGDYPNLTSMGCPPGCSIRSMKVVPMLLSVPSISLFGLEGLEGREITTENEILSMLEEGYNSHILSVRVNSGCWVVCEHSNYRGRQFLLEPIEITNWPKFSSLSSVGSMYPVRPKRHCFRVKNKETGNYLSVQGGVEEMKSGRVVAAPQVEPMSDVWYYQDGLLKNKLAAGMALQVMGNVEPAAKVVLWTETRQPIQTWTAQTLGLVTSLTFPGFVLDVKGGKSYDKDHVVIMPESDERPSQQWKIELL